jgi:PAS domain S-box-containing protein
VANVQKNETGNLRNRAEDKLAQQPAELKGISSQDVIQNEDLRQSQDELSESRDRYQELFNTVPVGYFVLNTKNIILDVNQTAAQMLATTKEKFYQKRFTSLVSASSRQTYYTEVIKVLEEHRQREFDLEMIREDRSRFLAYLYIMPIQNNEGKVSQVRIAMVDVTGRRQTEEALKESEETLSLMFASIKDAITVTDLNGRIIRCNEAAALMAGYRSPQELIGRNSLELIAKADWPKAMDNIQRTLKKGSVKDVQYSLLAKNGSEFPGELSASVIKNTTGKPIGFIAVIKDITERIRIEDALVKANDELEIKVKERTAQLAESEEEYRNLVENANEGVSVIQDGINKLVNKKGLEISGYSMEELTDKPFTELAHPDDQQAILESYQRFMAGEAVQLNFEFRILRKDGSNRWLQMNVANTTWKERPAILTMFTDITERKQAEEKILQMFRYRALLTEISTRLINEPVENLDQEILDAQRRICEFLDLDISSIYQSSPETAPSLKLTYLYRRLEGPPVPRTMIAREHFPWCEQQLVSGKEAIVVPSTRELPAEAARDQASWQYYGIKSSVMFPLLAQGGEVIGTLSFDSVRRECPWPEDLVSGMKLAAQVFANAIARKQFEVALAESEAQAKALIEYAPAAIYEIDIRSFRYISVNDAMSAITGYSRKELLAMNPLDLMDENGRKLFSDRIKRIQTGKRIEKEFDSKVRRKDGTLIDVTIQTTLSPRGSNIVFVVAHDITERKKMEEALKTYAWRITKVQEDERKRIGYELHDDTAQYLGILKMQLDALLHSEKVQDPEVTKKLEYLEKDADMAFNDVRRYSHELRPVTLERSGLTAALDQIAEDFDKLGQLQVTIKVGGKEPQLSEEVKLGFFRIAQEALNNARKHAKARQAAITISFRENRLKMSVRDDGIGFDVREAVARAGGKGSLGLMSMRERADLIGASLKIESNPGTGTKIDVEKVFGASL